MTKGRLSIPSLVTLFGLCAPLACGGEAQIVEAASDDRDAGPADDEADASGEIDPGALDAWAEETRAEAASPDAASFDWGKAIVDSTMKRIPDATSLAWGYQPALFLHGAYLVYTRTHDSHVLAYIKAWADSKIDANGAIHNGFNSLDSMMPANVLLDLYEETHDLKYSHAPANVRARLDTYPRTSDGAFWHATSRTGQTWGDGTFMALPFLARYGHLFNDAAYADDETTKQLIAYHNHLSDPSNGLHFHAWDETGKASWTVPGAKHSAEVWCRAVGWYAMASVMVLDQLPVNHPNRPQVITILQGLIDGIKATQDPATGRWFQVVDKGSDPHNWLETSCSSMFTFAISRAVERGYVAHAYAPVAARGYHGVLQEISIGSDGLTNVADICVGTNVGALAYYEGRKRATNDFHGLGAFLIMIEQLR
jgi:unsaturated rhamnogalacturonyl hydrolase